MIEGIFATFYGRCDLDDVQFSDQFESAVVALAERHNGDGRWHEEALPHEEWLDLLARKATQFFTECSDMPFTGTAIDHQFAIGLGHTFLNINDVFVEGYSDEAEARYLDYIYFGLSEASVYLWVRHVVGELSLN